MKSHSQEPWRIEDGAIRSDSAWLPSDDSICTCTNGPDARRIIACVNILAGADIEKLETILQRGCTIAIAAPPQGRNGRFEAWLEFTPPKPPPTLVPK